jgi:hypothetical protein
VRDFGEIAAIAIHRCADAVRRNLDVILAADRLHSIPKTRFRALQSVNFDGTQKRAIS